MTDIYIDLYVLAGADIANVIPEMASLASRIGVGVGATLNGVRTFAQPGCDGDDLLRKWREQLSLPEGTTKVAVGIAGRAS